MERLSEADHMIVILEVGYGKNRFFFEATAGAVERLARFYDWFSPALIGLHRLRTSVTKSLRGKDVDEKTLESRFNKGSGIRWSAYHGMISKKWPDICSEAAYALINESCSVLEGWLEDVFSREVSNNVFMAFNDEGANSLRTKAIKIYVISLRQGML